MSFSTKLKLLCKFKTTNVNALDKVGDSLLHIATNKRALNDVKVLVENGANINFENKIKETPLHNSVYKNHLKTIEYLLEKGANINVKSTSGLTPLHLAIYNKNLNIAELLLKHGANIDEPSNEGTLLYETVKGNRSFEIAEFLINNGADVNYIGSTSMSILHYAAMYIGNLKLVKLLIEKGAKLDVKNGSGKTPIQLAEDYQIKTYLNELVTKE